MSGSPPRPGAWEAARRAPARPADPRPHLTIHLCSPLAAAPGFKLVCTFFGFLPLLSGSFSVSVSLIFFFSFFLLFRGVFFFVFFLLVVGFILVSIAAFYFLSAPPQSAHLSFIKASLSPPLPPPPPPHPFPPPTPLFRLMKFLLVPLLRVDERHFSSVL